MLKEVVSAATLIHLILILSFLSGNCRAEDDASGDAGGDENDTTEAEAASGKI